MPILLPGSLAARTVPVVEYGQNNDGSDDDSLKIRSQPSELASVADGEDQYGANNGPWDAALSSKERGTADDRGGHGIEFIADARILGGHAGA